MKSWSARLNATIEWNGDIVPLSNVVESESFEELILAIQEGVVDCPHWMRILPTPSNPDTDLDTYAASLRQDMPGFPWGEESPVSDYFEVQVANGGIWIYSRAQEKLAALFG
jgi:hypothetical protein